MDNIWIYMDNGFSMDNLCDIYWTMKRRPSPLIGWREKLQENRIFHVKIDGFRLRFSLKSAHWRYLLVNSDNYGKSLFFWGKTHYKWPLSMENGDVHINMVNSELTDINYQIYFQKLIISDIMGFKGYVIDHYYKIIRSLKCISCISGIYTIYCIYCISCISCIPPYGYPLVNIYMAMDRFSILMEKLTISYKLNVKISL